MSSSQQTTSNDVPKELLTEIQQPHDLKPTETHDSSAPVIDSDTHVHKSTTLHLKENLAYAKDVIVDNVQWAKEKLVGTNPNPPKELLNEIQQPHDLKHAETEDKSAPVIGQDVHIKENHHKELLGELQQPHELNPTQTHDTSAPVVNEDTHVHKSATLRLKENVAYAKDVIVDNVQWAKEKLVGANHNPPKDLLNEIHQPHDLKPTETEDKSAPVIGEDVHIKENHHKELLGEIQQPHDLKHAETHDSSAPVVTADTHVHKSATLHVKENVAYAKDVIVDNALWAKEKLGETAFNTKDVIVDNALWAKEKLGETALNTKDVIVDNAQWAKEKLGEKAHNTKEVVAENVENAKETAVKTKDTLVEGLKENAEAAKETLAHNAAYASAKLANINAPGGVPTAPSQPVVEKPLLPPQPVDNPHHEQAFTDKIAHHEFELHKPKENPVGTFPEPPPGAPLTFEQPHQQAFTEKIGTSEAKLSKSPVPVPPENQFTNPPEQPHEKAFTEQIVNHESKVKTLQGEQGSQQIPIE